MVNEPSPAEAQSGSAVDRFSIDDLIQWLGKRRNDDPDAPLIDLIGANKLSSEAVLELVAIDLIEQLRRGRPVVAEDYFAQFPVLARSRSHVLDLIDAEICVRRERNEGREVHFYTERFPNCADEIRQLFFLQQESEPILAKREPAPPAGGADQTVPLQVDDHEVESSGQFLIQRELSSADTVRRQANDHAQEPDDSIDVPIPIAPPAWMVGARCISTAICQGGRYWLVKGRDAEHGQSVAMKIIPMPSNIGRTERTRILDLCEICSAVSHPAWLAPRIAAINNGHLAVVRPWIFGNTLGGIGATSGNDDHVARLIRLSYALSAAHRVGATHGGVHRRNVTVDHHAEIHLIDVASSVSGWLNYLALWKNDLADTLPVRIALDTTSVCSLLADEALRCDRPDLIALLAKLNREIDFQQPDACARIGEAVQQCLDGIPVKKPWTFWR